MTAPQTTEPAADLLIHNARIATMSAPGATAAAIAIAGGRVVAVGSDTAVMSRRGTSDLVPQ